MSPGAHDDDYLPFWEREFNLKDYKPGVWAHLPEEEKDLWVEEVFQYYRHTYGFPYPMVDEARVRTHLNRLRSLSSDSLDAGGRRIRWNGSGLVLSSHFFPHIWEVAVRKMDSPDPTDLRATAMDLFQDDARLRTVIRSCLTRAPGVLPNHLLDMMQISFGRSSTPVGVAARFKPATAKFIWERYAPEGGIVYDYSCGWGGRMLGALSSKKGLTYVGVEPNSKTYQCLEDLRVVAERHYGPPGKAEVHQCGSEDFLPPDLVGQVDVAFSSPPYFDYEDYSREGSQSHVRYPSVNRWLSEYMYKTVDNCFRLLKSGGYYAINAKDTPHHSYVGHILRFAEGLGLKPYDTWQMEMMKRRGDDAQMAGGSYSFEPIYVFKKP